MDFTPKYFTTGYVAEKCGVSIQAISQWIDNGWIEDVEKDNNGRRVFTKLDLDRFVKFAKKRKSSGRTRGPRKK